MFVNRKQIDEADKSDNTSNHFRMRHTTRRDSSDSSINPMSFRDNLLNQLNQFNIFKKKPEEKGLIDAVVDSLFKNQKDYTSHDKDQIKIIG